MIGALRVNMGLDSAQFERGVKNTRQPLAALRNQFLAVAGAAAAAALGTAISALAMRGAAEIDKTAKAARRVGSSIGGFRALEMAAGEAGVAVSTLADAVQTMDRQIARGSKSATAALSRLGIAAKDLEGLDADQKLALSSTQSDEIELANDRIGRLGIIGQYVGEQLALKLVPSFGRLAVAITDSMRAGGPRDERGRGASAGPDLASSPERLANGFRVPLADAATRAGRWGCLCADRPVWWPGGEPHSFVAWGGDIDCPPSGSSGR